MYKVIQYETKTGIILNSDDRKAIREDGQYQLFSSIEEAKIFIRKNLHPGRGYILYDSNNNVIYENVYDEVIVEKKPSKKWWEFWNT